MSGNHDKESGFSFTPDWNKVSKIQHAVLPVCVQHASTKEVLAIMFMNKEAYELSCASKRLTLFTTSRGKIWVKGEESGETFEVVGFLTNCEQNSLLCRVLPNRGGICHVKDEDEKPYETCFYRKVKDLRDPYSLSFVR